MAEFAKWDTFYVIAGSAAGALIGLQFVVMTLIAQRPTRGAAEASSAFATPTIIHFSTVLFLSTTLRAPWQTILPIAILWGVVGFSGLVYAFMVARRMRKQKAYKPVFEDWLFHAAMPFTAYAVITGSALAAPTYTHEALFGIGGGTLTLLFTGIHNAWDAGSYHVLVKMPQSEPDGGRDDRSDQKPG
jgi:hypothetical protein